MKKRFISIAFVILLCLSLSVSAFATGVSVKFYDEVGVVSDATATSLEQKLTEISDKYQVEICIAVVETTGSYSVDSYVNSYYDINGLGYGENHDGVLLLIVMDEREYRILSNGLGATAISPDEIDVIGEDIATYLSNENYDDAFDEFISECEYQIDGEINGFPFDFKQNVIISLIVGIILAVIITNNMKNKLKSVKKQAAATGYTKPGSMQVTTSNDFFLYRTVNRVKKESNSSSSSGSSRNVGGGKF
ncbi:MAG: TPM domain-containing protein [Clostridia bacterium]|nr:TPM domain-containing protein [Clostridia bacterium]